MKLLWSICILQCLLILVLLFGDIGFDKPGKYGLAFDHFLVLMFFFVSLLVAAAVIIWRKKRWGYLIVQLLLLFIAAAAIAMN